MKRIVFAGIRVILVLTVAYLIARAVINGLIPLAASKLDPDIGGCFAKMPSAVVTWDLYAVLTVFVLAAVGGFVKRKGFRFLCGSLAVTAALLSAQVNTIPILRVVQIALAVIGG